MPITLANLGVLFFSSAVLQKTIVGFSKVYAIVIIPLLALLLIADQQFYGFFQNHLNILAFGIIEDETTSVMKSVWTDHPVIWITLIMIFLAFIVYKSIRYIYFQKSRDTSLPFARWFLIFFPFLFLGLYFVGLRGSFGIYPFQEDDTTVSDNAFINSVANNGIFTLKIAFKEKKNQMKKVDRNVILKRYGYSAVQDALADYFDQPAATFNEPDYTKYLFQKTDTSIFLKNNPPNVVFFLMESMGGYYLNFHSKELNLLGALESNIKDDILFRSFLCSTRGTIYSLESIMINTSMTPLASTQHRFKSYKSSVAYPFHKAGYQTSFITGGKSGWRNINEFVPRQYFDEMEGKETILRAIPGSIENTWGVYDQYLFDYVFQKLQQNEGKPKMVFALSTSNHSPYELPADYHPQSIILSDKVKKMITSDEKIATKNFTAYQYSNDCLGRFINRIKKSSLGKNTIIAATGDHNSYGLFPYESNMDIKSKYEVPLYLYIPEQYKQGILIDTSRYGSHKDIFSTLINLSLSGENYFALGNNLLDPDKKKEAFFGISEYFEMTDPMLSQEKLQKKIKAWRALSECYINDQF